MTTPVAVRHPGHKTVQLGPVEAHERRVRRRVGLVWGLLVFNVLTYQGSVVHIPSIAGKGIAQAALPVALFVALTVNRRVMVRPNVFLCLVVLLAIGAILAALQPQSVGTVYRTFRLLEFVAVLWLLTPWWGRRDLLLVRCHLISLWVVLGSVVLSLLVTPGSAMAGGRLNGTLWAIPATQVAHYAAVTFGLVVILWFCGRMRGNVTLLVASAAAIMLILTHTRTALVGVVTATVVASLSLVVAKARVRKVLLTSAAVTSIVGVTLYSAITTWLARGEGKNQILDLTGRTQVWSALLAYPRTTFQEIFGFGLSNDSFNGLPIDSNWIASYQTQGLYGVVICAIILLFLLVTAYFQPRGVQRALAIFLVTYCLVASFTEVGFTDASMYLLELFLAASLLVPRTAVTKPT